MREGNYDKAMKYLQIMMSHAQKISRGKKCCGRGVLEGLSIHASQDNMLTYMINGVDDLNKTIPEQLKNRLRLGIYAPLWEREDFKALVD